MENTTIIGDNGKDCNSPYHNEDKCKYCQEQKRQNELDNCIACGDEFEKAELKDGKCKECIEIENEEKQYILNQNLNQ